MTRFFPLRWVAALLLLVGTGRPAEAQNQTAIPYGNNPQAGRYQSVGDANLYYEVYGRGKPVVLLHGGLYGYIGEYEYLIPKLAQTHQVIAIATRGHGKSELGTKPFSREQLAEDAYRVIQAVTTDSVVVIGFSDGGITGYHLTARHSERVRKLVAIGAPRRPTDRTAAAPTNEIITAERLEKESPDFVRNRKQLMPQPERWSELLDQLNRMWHQPSFISDEALRSIRCPVLLLAGDQDVYFKTEQVVETYRLFPNGTLALIPGCHHVVMYCNFPAMWEAMAPFIR